MINWRYVSWRPVGTADHPDIDGCFSAYRPGEEETPVESAPVAVGG
ncbi:hypothetical protein [Sphingobacterium yanglingense]|uniref:Uncharacterized protein n=1 Tax=Sphingobacterium yanglingense TaxID=1437280 RepID=A0A4R6WJW0_9SPHI|nr:hypothetical protein [Sphingobacterium yanglingense]TDQ79207.1 hypothetical protein CLV99_0639 [Sphingobacterium yanglingense]